MIGRAFEGRDEPIVLLITTIIPIVTTHIFLLCRRCWVSWMGQRRSEREREENINIQLTNYMDFQDPHLSRIWLSSAVLQHLKRWNLVTIEFCRLPLPNRNGPWHLLRLFQRLFEIIHLKALFPYELLLFQNSRPANWLLEWGSSTSPALVASRFTGSLWPLTLGDMPQAW